jgi:hypothetical protein
MKSVVVAALALVVGMLLWSREPVATLPGRLVPDAPGGRMFTPAALRAIVLRQEPLLAIAVGRVYNVSAGRSFYRAGEGYAGFANGTDNSRAFLTADFANNASDDLSGLTPNECAGVEHWANFYAEHEKYTLVGALVGRYYDADGQETDALRAFRACNAEYAQLVELVRQLVEAAPACVREETSPPPEKRGVWHRFSCDAPRLPRRVRLPGASEKCTCLLPEEAQLHPDDELAPRLYRNCEEQASQCSIRTK